MKYCNLVVEQIMEVPQKDSKRIQKVNYKRLIVNRDRYMFYDE